MADVVIPFSGGEATVSKGVGPWPVEIEFRSLASHPDTIVDGSFTRRDAERLRDAITAVLDG